MRLLWYAAFNYGNVMLVGCRAYIGLLTSHYVQRIHESANGKLASHYNNNVVQRIGLRVIMPKFHYSASSKL